jgi:hypothetical protein
MRSFCKALLCVFSVLAFGAQTHAQQPSQQPELGKPYHSLPPPGALRVDTDNKARDLVALILSQYGLKLDDDQWKIWIDITQGNDTPDAMAGFSGGKRWIVFNEAFMERLSRGRHGNWHIYAIAAHEVSHHLGNHVLRRFLPRQLAEREADYHAGFVLGRMGASYGQTTGVVRWLPGGGQVTDYPPRSQRLCELGRGWRDGKGLDPLSTVTADGKSVLALLCTGQKPDSTRFIWRENHDSYGHDILFDGKPGIPGLDLASCALLCDNTPNCKGFSFDRWFGWCYLKDEITDSIVDPPSVMGVKRPKGLPPRNATAEIKMIDGGNKRFRDTPIAETSLKSVGDCKRQCRTHKRCFVYTFLVAQERCLMFETTEGPYIDDGAVSGFKQQEQTKPKKG